METATTGKIAVSSREAVGSTRKNRIREMLKTVETGKVISSSGISRNGEDASSTGNRSNRGKTCTISGRRYGGAGYNRSHGGCNNYTNCSSDSCLDCVSH